MWFEHPDGRVAVEDLGDGRRLLVVHENPGVFVSVRECVTTYPDDLIALIVSAKGPSYVGDEVSRDEDRMYVTRSLRYGLLGYVPEEAFRGARILDFGSGSGASTAILSRMFPDAEIIGVELVPELIAIARRRAEHHGLTKLTFIESPDPSRLPDGIGEFDFINVGAVYEHLLPDERPRLMPQLWSALKVGGVIFVNQLPYRYYPIEAHTTGLPLINYLPDRLTLAAAKKFSPRIGPDATWPRLLRDGIRGGSDRSVKRDLERGGGDAVLLTPTQMGLHDHADLWFRDSYEGRPHPLKRVMRLSFKAASRLTRTTVAPGLSLAFEKRA